MKRALVLVAIVLVACKKEPAPAQATFEAGGPSPSATPELIAIADAQGDPCTGPVVDLSRALRDAKCHVAFDARPSKGAYDKVDVRLTPSASKVPRGGELDFDLVLTNRGDAPVPLVFGGTPLGLSLTVFDASDKPTDVPSGTCACLQTITEHALSWAKVVLPPGGEARARWRWHATKTKHGGCLPGGCAVVPDGALAAGAYRARVRVPLWTRHAEQDAHPDWASEWPGAMPEVPIAVE